MSVRHLDHVNMSVRNLDESVDWYRRVFGFEKVEGGLYDGRPWAIVKSGEALLCLYEHPERKEPDPEVHGHHAASHFGIRIDGREEWEATVAREHVPVQYGGAFRWPHSTSWYVSDPTGHEIEVALWDDDVVRFGPRAAS